MHPTTKQMDIRMRQLPYRMANVAETRYTASEGESTKQMDYECRVALQPVQ